MFTERYRSLARCCTPGVMRNTPDFQSTLPTTCSGRTMHDLRPRSSSHGLACCETGVWIQFSTGCLLLVGDVGSWCHAAVEREALQSDGGVERLGRTPWRIGNREMASARRQQASLLTIPPRPRLLVLAAPGAMLPWGWLVKPKPGWTAEQGTDVPLASPPI